METKRIIIFLALVFGITFAVEFGIIYPLVGQYGYGTNPIVTLAVAGVMFIPALCVVLTRLITGEGFKNSWLRPHFKGNIKYYLFAWLAPSVLITIGAVVYYLCFPEQFDPNSGYIMKTMSEVGGELPANMPPLKVLIIGQTITAVLFGPILNFITCFGEEWGWRGYLLPKMADKMPRIPMLLITGTIWGLWHAPIIAVGHNYGTDYWGFPIVGILMMCVFCIALGTIFSYLCMKTQSCIPGVIAHGAINSFAGAGLFFAATNNNALLGPTPAGIIGGCGLIAAAIIILIYWDKDEKIFHFVRLKLFQLKLFGKHETSKQIKY